MTPEFLKGLGLEDAAIDSIISENEQDVNEEKQKTANAKEELKDAKEKLETAQADLEALRQSSGDTAGLQKKLDDLKTEANTLRDQLADRDYTDGMKAAVAGKGLKFSSKAAERDFMAQLKEKRLELKDGELVGLDDFINARKEDDPYAFASDKQMPRFMGPTGAGGAPPAPEPKSVLFARELGESRVSALKSSSETSKVFM